MGIMIFVDDGFNCLTVGSVMRPITDKYKVSRAKFAYLIDATAAPVCIIAPISCWAAAVTYAVPGEYHINGFQMFLRTPQRSCTDIAAKRPGDLPFQKKPYREKGMIRADIGNDHARSDHFSNLKYPLIHYLSKKSFSRLERVGCLSLRSAFASI